MGLLSPLMLIPALPEMITAATMYFPTQKAEINDISAGVFNAFLGIGQLCAPTYGSWMFERTGFRVTSDIVALICLVFSIIYLVLGDGIKAFQESFPDEDQSHFADLYDEIDKL